MRVVRSDGATQVPRRMARFARLLFEILILRLRRRWLERKSLKNWSETDENGVKIDKNRSWAVLGARSCFGDTPGRAQNGFGAFETHPDDDLGTLWER